MKFFVQTDMIVKNCMYMFFWYKYIKFYWWIEKEVMPPPTHPTPWILLNMHFSQSFLLNPPFMSSSPLKNFWIPFWVWIMKYTASDWVLATSSFMKYVFTYIPVEQMMDLYYVLLSEWVWASHCQADLPRGQEGELSRGWGQSDLGGREWMGEVLEHHPQQTDRRIRGPPAVWV